MKKLLACILAACLLMGALASCGGQKPGEDGTSAPGVTQPAGTTKGDGSEGTKNTEKPEEPKDPYEGRKVAEVLIEEIRRLLKENPGISDTKLSNTLAIHPYLESFEMTSFTQTWREGYYKIYPMGLKYDFSLPACASFTTWNDEEQKKPFIGGIIHLNKGTDAAAYCETIKENVDTSEINSTAEVEFEIGYEGLTVFYVLCTEELRVETGTGTELTAAQLLKRLRLAVGINMPVKVFDINGDRASYYVGVKDKTLFESDAAVCEPDMGGGFSLVILKVKNAEDAARVTEDVTMDLGKWICMRAESMSKAYSGKYIVAVMGDKEECERIVSAFRGLFEN